MKGNQGKNPMLHKVKDFRQDNYTGYVILYWKKMYYKGHHWNSRQNWKISYR